MKRIKADYYGYELGNFLLPKYPEWEGCDVFFMLLQYPAHKSTSEKFSVKLGKTRLLQGDFWSDCLKALVYLEIDGGKFDIYDIELQKKKDGTLFFDATLFLDNLGIAYEPIDTSHYRYFKSRLNEHRRELVFDLVFDTGGNSFSIIHRRINADDYESYRTYYNKATTSTEILRNSYFLVEFAKDHLIDYRSLLFFRSKSEVKEYIRLEYVGTNAEAVTTFTISELLAGQTYNIGHRQGMHLSQVHVILIHNSNLKELYRFVDESELKDRDGNAILFSDLLKKAETPDEIERIVDLFNDVQDNVW